MKNCPTCGALNDNDAHFCETCGTPLDSHTEENDLFDAADSDMTIMSTAGQLKGQQEKTVKVNQSALEEALQQPAGPPPLPVPIEPSAPTASQYAPPPGSYQPVDAAPPPLVEPDLVEKAGDDGGKKKKIIIAAVIIGVLALCCCCSSIIAGSIMADPSMFNF
jgi:hypothetical protein